jgi:hypothetical protein
MQAETHIIGQEGHKVLVIDDLFDEPERLIDEAVARSPFPQEEKSYYPGVRCMIRPGDGAVAQYVNHSLRVLQPLMRDVFGIHEGQVTEACFSLVTKRPETLLPLQRAPHFDGRHPKLYALLHYLSPVAQGGTAFYRHKATGFERMSDERLPVYLAARNAETAASGAPRGGFITGSNEHFEQIAHFEARFNRMLIYRGCVLHSGQIPEDFGYSADPAKGRLTFNMFMMTV